MRLVIQREDAADCAICCLATLLEFSWERVFLEASRIHGYVLYNGLSTANILRVAKALGKPLVALPRRQWEPDEATGILEVIGNNHVVLLHEGSVVDLRQPSIESFDDHFKADLIRPGKLLVLK